MVQGLTYRIKLWTEKFSEAWTACALCMVQGDLTVFTLSHAITAAKTGTLTGIAFVLTSFISRINNKWGNAAVTGILTAMADIVIHPTHYGTWYTESIVTGVGAGILALILLNTKGVQQWLK